MDVHNLYEQSSAIHLFLAELRDHSIQKDRERFRQNMAKLGMLVGFEISKIFPFEEQEVFTPLGTAKAKISTVQPVIISILRASIPFYNGLMEIYPQADSGFVGSFRATDEKENIRIQSDYLATGIVEGEIIIIADPMIATGKSVIDAVNALKPKGTPKEIHVASVVAAPEGIKFLSGKLPASSHLWTCAIDKKLNSKSYIVPGLGDAGDLSFGPKT